MHSNSYGVYIGILTGLCILIYFQFPETKDMTIEEIALVFDGDKALGILQASQGESQLTEHTEADSDREGEPVGTKNASPMQHVEYTKTS